MEEHDALEIAYRNGYEKGKQDGKRELLDCIITSIDKEPSMNLLSILGILRESNNTCVCCGDVIPEGTQVCKSCSDNDHIYWS